VLISKIEGGVEGVDEEGEGLAAVAELVADEHCGGED